jgi:hypothetical protein
MRHDEPAGDRSNPRAHPPAECYRVANLLRSIRLAMEVREDELCQAFRVVQTI